MRNKLFFINITETILSNMIMFIWHGQWTQQDIRYVTYIGYICVEYFIGSEYTAYGYYLYQYSASD